MKKIGSADSSWTPGLTSGMTSTECSLYDSYSASVLLYFTCIMMKIHEVLLILNLSVNFFVSCSCSLKFEQHLDSL